MVIATKSRAEEIVLKQCQKGLKAECSDEEGNKGVVRAEFLRSLALDYKAASIDPRGILIKDALITDGPLDFEDCTLSIPLSFQNCTFSAGKQTNHSDTYQGDYAIVLKDAKLMGIAIRGCDIQGIIEAERVFDQGSLWVSDSTLNGELILTEANIIGPLKLDKLQIQKINPDTEPVLKADRIVVSGNWDFRNATIKGSVKAQGIEVRGHLDCSGTSISTLASTALNARDGTFLGGVIFGEKSSAVGGKCSNNMLFCADAAIVFDGSTFKNRLDLSHSQIKSKNWREFQKLQDQDNQKQSGMTSWFRAKGKTVLKQADIENKSAEDTGYEGRALSFINTTIPHLIMPCSKQNTPQGIIDFSQAKIGSYEDYKKGWPTKNEKWTPKRHIIMDGFEYDYFRYPTGDPDSLETKVADIRKKWLLQVLSHDDLHKTFKPSPWVQLAKTVKKQGYYRESKEINVARREQYSHSLSLPRQLGFGLLGVSSRYGLSTGRTIVSMFVLFFLFSQVWQWGKTFCADSGCRDESLFVRTAVDEYNNITFYPKNPKSTYPLFNAYGYSFDVLLPVIGFGYQNTWSVNTSYCEFNPSLPFSIPFVTTEREASKNMKLAPQTLLAQSEMELTSRSPKVGVSKCEAWKKKSQLRHVTPVTLTVGGFFYFLYLFEIVIGIILTSQLITSYTGLVNNDE